MQTIPTTVNVILKKAHNFPSLHFLKEQGPVGSEEEETFLPLLYAQRKKILILPVIFSFE